MDLLRPKASSGKPEANKVRQAFDSVNTLETIAKLRMSNGCRYGRRGGKPSLLTSASAPLRYAFTFRLSFFMEGEPIKESLQKVSTAALSIFSPRQRRLKNVPPPKHSRGNE